MAQYAPITAPPDSSWHPTSSLATQHRSNILSAKRKAEDELDSQSHTISSQFKKLRLNQNQSTANAAASLLQTYNTNTLPSSPSTSSSSSQHHVVHHHHQSHNHLRSSPPPSPTYRPLIPNTDARPGPTPIPQPARPTTLTQNHHDYDGDEDIPLDDSPLPSQHNHRPQHAPPPSSLPPLPLTNTDTDTDIMPVDETPHRIIIHDLSREIADIEAAEARESQSLLPADVDKTISALPHHLLQQQRHTQSQAPQPRGVPNSIPPWQENPSTALILYRDPTSISVPEDEDVVRKTIIEARRRARERTAMAVGQRAREQQQDRARRGVIVSDAKDSVLRGVTPGDSDGEGDGDGDVDLMDIE